MTTLNKPTLGVSRERENHPYQAMLNNVFLERRSRNPRYSLRAFANSLEVSRTTLSDVLSGKRHFSTKNALKVASRLSLSPEETRELIVETQGLKSKALPTLGFQILEEDAFRMISDWYHYAILNLARLKNNRGDAFWIASRLGISPLEARTAILRLSRMGYVEIRDGRLFRTSAPLDTPVHISNEALRKYQKQNLRLADISIDRDGLDRRYVSSMVFATKPERVMKAKKMISKFRERLTQYLECDNPTDVYTLGIQVFPLTTKGSGK